MQQTFSICKYIKANVHVPVFVPSFVFISPVNRWRD